MLINPEHSPDGQRCRRGHAPCAGLTSFIAEHGVGARQPHHRPIQLLSHLSDGTDETVERSLPIFARAIQHTDSSSRA
ncbi:MAG: hypothetical protein M3300_09585 [Actinomycetota bacterium]|nr:hypothetical protein [Actinomycetota bacterium]